MWNIVGGKCLGFNFLLNDCLYGGEVNDLQKAGKRNHPNYYTGTGQPVVALPLNAERQAGKVSGVSASELGALPTVRSGPVEHRKKTLNDLYLHF